MRTFAQKQKPAAQTKSASFAKPGRPHLGQSRDVLSILHLQRTIGNQSVQRLLQSNAERLQAGSATTASKSFGHDFSRIPLYAEAQQKIEPSLTISTPGDIYEQEADRVSDQVMRMPEPQLQSACACIGGCPKGRKEQDGYEQLQLTRVQAHDAGEVTVPLIVQEAISSPGQPLDQTTREFVESRFGHDFSKVRIHTGAQAAELARSVGARAFTVRNDIVFGNGQYTPLQTDGRRLLAHELTHVLQQRERSAVRPMIQRAIILTDPGDEVPHPPDDVRPFPTKAFTLNSWLDTLCPDGNWGVDYMTGVVDSPDRAIFCGARPTRGQAHHTTSAHPTSCDCLCELTAHGSRNVEVQIDDYLRVPGLAPIDLRTPRIGGAATFTDVPGMEPDIPNVDAISALTGEQRNVRGPGLSPYGWPNVVSVPPWLAFAHEVCGHARLERGLITGERRFAHAATSRGNRTTMDIENRIRREHSTVSSSLGIRRGQFQARNAAGFFHSYWGAMYQVSSGEILSGIAVRCGIPVSNMLDHIWRLNGDRITGAGQHQIGLDEHLLIEGIDWHEVIRGENISTIAQMWSIPLLSLQRANPQITGPLFIIQPGERLLIPAS